MPKNAGIHGVYASLHNILRNVFVLSQALMSLVNMHEGHSSTEHVRILYKPEVVFQSLLALLKTEGLLVFVRFFGGVDFLGFSYEKFHSLHIFREFGPFIGLS